MRNVVNINNRKIFFQLSSKMFNYANALHQTYTGGICIQIQGVKSTIGGP